MALTAYPDADFVQFTIAGVYCMNCHEFTPGAEQEWCIGTRALVPDEEGNEIYSGCGSNALILVEAGAWHGGRPNPGGVYFVEHDLSSGMIGYKIPSPEQMATHREEQRKATEAWSAHERMRDKRLAEMKALAHKDPGYKLLLQHQGVLPED